MTAAGRGREERGGWALALLSSALPQALRSPTAQGPLRLLPQEPRVGPRPLLVPRLSTPVGTLLAPSPSVCYATRGRRVSALSWPPGAPSQGPGGTGGGRRGPCGARVAKRVCPIPETWTDPMTSSPVSRWRGVAGGRVDSIPPRPLRLCPLPSPYPHSVPFPNTLRLLWVPGHWGLKPWVPRWGNRVGRAGGQVGRGSRCGPL